MVYVVALQRKLVSIVDRPETLFCFAQSTFVTARQLALEHNFISGSRVYKLTSRKTSVARAMKVLHAEIGMMLSAN